MKFNQIITALAVVSVGLAIFVVFLLVRNNDLNNQLADAQTEVTSVKADTRWCNETADDIMYYTEEAYNVLIDSYNNNYWLTAEEEGVLTDFAVWRDSTFADWYKSCQ